MDPQRNKGTLSCNGQGDILKQRKRIGCTGTLPAVVTGPGEKMENLPVIALGGKLCCDRVR